MWVLTIPDLLNPAMWALSGMNFILVEFWPPDSRRKAICAEPQWELFSSCGIWFLVKNHLATSSAVDLTAWALAVTVCWATWQVCPALFSCGWTSVVSGKMVSVDKLSSPPHPTLPLLGALYYAGLIKLQNQSWLNQRLTHPLNGCSHPHFPSRAMFVSCTGTRQALLPLYSVVLAVSDTLENCLFSKTKNKKNSVKCFL